MKYLVTGGAGFIGSNLVEALVERGDDVVVLDDLSTGSRSNLEPWLDRVTLIERSVADVEACRAACEGVDHVLHQAALGSVPRSVENPGRTHDVNATGTLTLLQAAREAGVSRFVYAASSSAYGNTAELPKHEGMVPRPLSPYAVSKLTGEHYCRAFTATYGLPTVALRYFNVFGPRQDPDSQYAAVIPLFVAAAAADEPPTIFGDGEQTRDFTFVDNVVAANLAACDAPEQAWGEVVNIGVGGRISINQLWREISRLVGTGVEPEYAPSRPGDVRDSMASLERAQRLIGYDPRVQLEEGLERTVRWFEGRSEEVAA